MRQETLRYGFSDPFGERTGGKMQAPEQATMRIPLGTLVATEDLKEGNLERFIPKNRPRNLEEVLKAIKERYVAGIHIGDFLFKHQDRIPKKWRGSKILLMGDILIDGNTRFVRCLIWSGSDNGWKWGTQTFTNELDADDQPKKWYPILVFSEEAIKRGVLKFPK